MYPFSQLFTLVRNKTIWMTLNGSNHPWMFNINGIPRVIMDCATIFKSHLIVKHLKGKLSTHVTSIVKWMNPQSSNYFCLQFSSATECVIIHLFAGIFSLSMGDECCLLYFSLIGVVMSVDFPLHCLQEECPRVDCTKGNLNTSGKTASITTHV